MAQCIQLVEQRAQVRFELVSCSLLLVLWRCACHLVQVVSLVQVSQALAYTLSSQQASLALSKYRLVQIQTGEQAALGLS